MKYRKFGKTGWDVSEVALGTWQVGGGWGGSFDHKAASQIIHTALDSGVNFIDQQMSMMQGSVRQLLEK
ncbi:putative oxidoreductase protein [Indibacter alkaliphilus LW1]|uniref:Oxidoreductase protein n=1 Tax=Indibacter alkaliphilus (strain CCUG 57479 / KCTC 22604 / LW1) TaxID=1189612 RepID=S2DEY6_INDAL|nr:putative oxidoreductase protein [Indibacter alkaliphilus LW1]